VAALALVLTCGFTAAGLTAVVRALAPLSWQLRKPVSCDLCMSWWCSWLALLNVAYVKVIAAMGFLGAWTPGGLEMQLRLAVPTLPYVFAVTGAALLITKVAIALDAATHALRSGGQPPADL
jgi:hypothetical protein